MSNEQPAAAQAQPNAEAVEQKPTTEAAPAPAAQAASADASQPSGKPEAEQPTEQVVVPEKYDLKVPEGSQLPAARLEKIAADAKAQGLSQEQAQAIVEREHAAIADYASAQASMFEQQAKTWVSEAQADKEIGGEAFKQNVEMAKRVLDRYASDSLKQTLNQTGLGNHPELVRMFVRLGKQMSEDQLVVPGAMPSAKRSMEDVFYGKKD